MSSHRSAALTATLVWLVTALGWFVVAPAAHAGTPPLPTQSVTLEPGPTSIHVRWAVNDDDIRTSAVIVTRSGVSADGVLSLTKTIPSTRADPAWDTTFDGLVPGARYTISVAFANRSGTSPAVEQRTTLSSAGLPTLVNASMYIHTAPVLDARSYDDILCSIYHFNNQQCGEFAVTITTTGYSSTTADAYWTLTAKTSRTFGCVRPGTTAYQTRTTIVRRISTLQYGYWAYEPVTVKADGTSTNSLPHNFGNPPSYAATDDMPHFVCAPGWDVAQSSATVSDAVAVLHAGHEAESAGPILGVLYVPGSASAAPTGLG